MLHTSLRWFLIVTFFNHSGSIQSTLSGPSLSFVIFINTDPHTPTILQKWSIYYPIFKEATANVWHIIFELPFKIVRDTKIQTFQYRIIQNIIPCNKWLHNIKIKNSPVCDYCTNVYDLPHYFIWCSKVAECWCYWFNWWGNISGIDIRDSQVTEECILFGFLLNNDVMHVLNFCTLYAKHYIYIQRLFNNNTLDLYVCLTQLKQALRIEENICRKNNNEDNFFKFHLIYEKL